MSRGYRYDLCACGRQKLKDSATCRPCHDKAHAAVAAPSPVLKPAPTVAVEAEALIRKALKTRAMALDLLAQAVDLTPGQTLDTLLALKKSGVNLYELGGQWSIESAPQTDAAPKAAYRSRPDGTYRFGWVGDNHLCSKYERLDVLDDLYRRFAVSDLDRVFNAGNWIDGEARFNRFDIHTHGMHAQVKYLCDKYPTANGLTTYAIAGDDHEGWYCQREGVDIGSMAEDAMRKAGRTDWVNLGYMEAFIPLEHARTGATSYLQLVHPGGGSAYATSYTVQKLVESYSGGSKPAVLLAGHYHKLEFINVRNVWCIQTGCTQDQTPFMRKKRLHAAVGGGICELEQDQETGAIIGCTVKAWHYFDRGFYSNRWSMSGGVTLPERSIGI